MTTTMDEWIFSVRTSQQKLYELRQSQPAPTTDSTKKKHEAAAATTTTAKDDEREALLLQSSSRKSNTAAAADANVSTRSSSSSTLASTTTGWKFTSPYWQFSSQILLQATFRPYWQGLPAFSNCRGGSTRCATGCCGCSCCSKKLDFHSTCWTTSDVLRVQTDLPPQHIMGVGECATLRIELQPMDLQNCLPTSMPSDNGGSNEVLRQAWAEMKENIEKSRSARQLNSEDGNSTPLIGGPVLTFCLPTRQVDPPLLWKVEFPVDTPLVLDTLTVLDGRLSSTNNTDGRISTAAPNKTTPVGEGSPNDTTTTTSSPSPTHIYIHGYQSWSFAGSISKGQDQPQSAMPDVFSKAFLNGATPRPQCVDDSVVSTVGGGGTFEPDGRNDSAKYYHSDFFTCVTSDDADDDDAVVDPEFPYQSLDETGGPALVLGWLAQRQQFGRIETDQETLEHYIMYASVGGQIVLPGDIVTTDWAHLQLVSPHSYDEEPMQNFLECVASHNDSRPLRNGSLLTGWCSWYHYYENIEADSLRDNFGKLASLRTQLPTNVSVVDDGYMTAWGDWDSLKPGKFSAGLPGVAQDIKDNGMRPGLWLAPYAADKHSQLAKDHPDWIIRNDLGAIANSSNCGKFFYGLDATNPAVREHAYESIRRAVHDWGYNVLKIDFLYAACLEGNGKFDLSMSRAQAMHLALQTIRDAAGPDVFLIGCGCPIGSGIGFADGMRISADTGPTWYPAPPLPWWDQGTLPCLRSMVRNSLTRAPLGHRFWHNDPDCLLLGASTRLTDEEVASAASIVAMTCGMMLLSDDLSQVSAARMKVISKVFPMTGVSAVVLDLHSATDSLPSLLRLWCTDKYNLVESFRENNRVGDPDHNAEATYFGRMSSFLTLDSDGVESEAERRKRSCVHVPKGLGTWTVISISNWTDHAAVVHVPPTAMLAPPSSGWTPEDCESDDDSCDEPDQHGYHVFGFWSAKYNWLPNQKVQREQEVSHYHVLSRKLAKHETEIYHIKPVTPDRAQYIGSDLHFTCGQEVHLFKATEDQVTLLLNTRYHRQGHVYLFLPRINTDSLKVTVAGESTQWQTVGNTPNDNENGHPRLVGRVVRIPITILGDGSPTDGQIKADF